MENKFLHGLREATNYDTTENGATVYRSTLNKCYDMFALGGSYRSRSEADCITLFKNAFDEDPILALRCLFYLRDIRGGGQGERRFFRVCIKWLAKEHPDYVHRNIKHIPEYARWDDLYALVGTPVEEKMFETMYHQLALDVKSDTPSLLAKWLKSENASSSESKALAARTREAFNMTPRQYRKTLSHLREEIKIIERLISAQRWDEIDFSKLPSNASMKYRNLFNRREELRERYQLFMRDKSTKINAGTLYPQNIAHLALKERNKELDDPSRIALQKAWENLPDYYNGREENGIAVVDVSGSMYGTPIEAAISLGAYVAEKSHGPFTNHFITFSAKPQLVRFEGVDIVDKFDRCLNADWGMNTNIEAVFDLLLQTAIDTKCKPEDMVQKLYVFSDMEFDDCVNSYSSRLLGAGDAKTFMDTIEAKWAFYGYKLPQLIFWNLSAKYNHIPSFKDDVSLVSGFSPSMIDCILGGKTGVDLMLEKLNSPRYQIIK